MSYRRTYSETIYQEKTVYYDASQNGGSKTVSVEVPIQVVIDVDTDAFDDSVDHCRSNVDLLTAAVVTTHSIELASKRRNSQKVAGSIIGGFFSYIRSEISQQVAELSQSVDAQLMHLRELMQACMSKKKQLESDYTRISGRYAKIFEDLNNELSNRIHELDKAAFTFDKQSKTQNTRLSDNQLVSTVSIFGVESGSLHSRISTSIAKKRALDTINKAKIFLWQQNKLNNTIQQSMLNESNTGLIYAPICYFETKNESNQIDKTIFLSDYLSVLNDPLHKREFIDDFSMNTINWFKINDSYKNNLNMQFNAVLNNKSTKNDRHSLRVREMIRKMADISSIYTINTK